MTHMSLNADGEAQSEQVWPQQQQQHVELQPGASKHQTAEFFLWTFKIEPCRADYPHNWSLCPYVHPNEKARRRDPRLFEYEPLPCPDDKKGTTCPRGEHCNYTHNIYEYWCHPKRFRTQVCQLGAACNRPICFFAHTAQELRRVDQPVHIPPTVARHPVTASSVDRYQWSYSSAAAATAAAVAAQQQAWQANAAAAATGQYGVYQQQQQLALQGLVAQQQLAMLQAARATGLANAAQVQQQMWQQQQEQLQQQQQQYQSAQVAAAANQYMAAQQALAQQQQQLMQQQQQRPALAAAVNACLAAAGRGTTAGMLAGGGVGSRPQNMLQTAGLLQQQQQAAALAQMQALAVSPTADMIVNGNLGNALGSRRSSGGMPGAVIIDTPAAAGGPSSSAAVVAGLAAGVAGPPAPLAVPTAARVASGGVMSLLAQYASGQLASELSGGLVSALPAAAADPTVAQQQLLALNEPIPLGIADQDLAVAAAVGGGAASPRYSYVQAPNSNNNSGYMLQGPGGGSMSASSVSTNNMGSVSVGGLSLGGSASGGSNIMTRLSPAAAMANGGSGRGMLLQQQQQAAEVELLQAAMKQMGVGNSQYLQDL